MLRQFFAKATAKAFLHVRTYGIQTSDLLFDQFASTKIFAKNF